MDSKRSGRRLHRHRRSTNSISLMGAADAGGNQNADFTIAAPAAGTGSLAWSCLGTDTAGPGLEPLDYHINGVFPQLAGNVLPIFTPSTTQTCTGFFSMLLDDVFGFRQNSDGSLDNSGPVTIAYFNGPLAALGTASVPAPLPRVGVGGALGWNRSLQKWVASSSSLRPAA